MAPWVAEYLDRGKPAELVQHARDLRLRGVFPPVLRPDLLLTQDGFALTELDSVPGGIGLTAFLNRLYDGGDGSIVGQGDRMVELIRPLAERTFNPRLGIVGAGGLPKQLAPNLGQDRVIQHTRRHGGIRRYPGRHRARDATGYQRPSRLARRG